MNEYCYSNLGTIYAKGLRCRRDWNFLGGGGFCKAKKVKEMNES